MTVSSGFFNSKNHDRVYDAEQFSSIFDGIVTDGVFQGYGEAFNIVSYPDASETVIVQTGRAWFDHTWTLNDSWMPITLDPPSTGATRYDAIVIDVDKTEFVRANSIKVVKGEYSDNPQYPTLIKEDFHKQYPLAYVKMGPRESGVIPQGDIYIMIGSDECPLVTGILETLDIDMFVSQMEYKFEAWFDTLENVLEGDIVLNLQNQINHLQEQLDEAEQGAIDPETLSRARKMKIKTVKPEHDYESNSPKVMNFPTTDGCVISVCADDKGTGNIRLWADLYDSNGVLITSSEDIDTNTKTSYPAYSFVSIDNNSYPTHVTVATYANDSNNLVCNLHTITATSNHMIGISSSTYNCSIDGGLGESTKYTLYASDKAVVYKEDGTRALYLVVKGTGTYTSQNGAWFIINPDGVVSSTVVLSSSQIASNDTVFGYKAYVADPPQKNRKVAVQAQYEVKNVTLYDPNSLAYTNKESLTKEPYVYGDSFDYIESECDAYIASDSNTIAHYYHGFKATDSVPIPMSMDVSWSLDGGSSFGQWVAASMSPKQDLLLVGTSNKVRAGIIPENGLMIYTSPQNSTALSGNGVMNTQKELPPGCFWNSNSDGTKFIFVKCFDYGNDIYENRFNVIEGTYPEYIIIEEEG